MKKCRNCSKELEKKQKRNQYCSRRCSALMAHRQGVFLESQKTISSKNIVYTERKIKETFNEERFSDKISVRKYSSALYFRFLNLKKTNSLLYNFLCQEIKNNYESVHPYTCNK